MTALAETVSESALVTVARPPAIPRRARDARVPREFSPVLEEQAQAELRHARSSNRVRDAAEVDRAEARAASEGGLPRRTSRGERRRPRSDAGYGSVVNAR